MLELKVYNTLTRKKEVFKSIKPGQVGMYSCGPTVYKTAQIGNFRAYIFMDELRRVLEYCGYRVKSVMNITDVGHLVSDADDGDAPPLADIPQSVIHRMIRTLPTGYRTVFNLYVFEERSHREIAGMLGIAESSSASQLHRAKNMLAKRIREYERTNPRRYERQMAE